MKQVSTLLLIIHFFCSYGQKITTGTIKNSNQNTESILQKIVIDSVWAGHRVGFSLYTHKNRQYIAYYNATRNIVVGQRNLEDQKFDLQTLPATSRETASGTSTVLGWDSHNYLTIGVDKNDFIHLSGNMHVNPITYFKSLKPNDIFTLEQEMFMIGADEKRCTYPKFMFTKEGELLFHYRIGGSGNGNEIYNSYSCETQKWYRMLDVPLTDGQGLMNAYQSQPRIMKDNWYHVYWVWRDTPDCSTNHDLSYMKSPDLKNWFDVFGQRITLPATLDQRTLIVDPIPPKGGIINLAAKLCLDENNKPVFVYHKYDLEGNLQLYAAAQLEGEKWSYTKITNWKHRWEFSGRGSLGGSELKIEGFGINKEGNYEVDYWHIKHGYGTILLNKKLHPIREVSKPKSFVAALNVQGSFPGLSIQTAGDSGKSENRHTRYILKWESLSSNGDKERPKPWPNPSELILYKLAKSAR